MDCVEYKRLIGGHLHAFAEWRLTFDNLSAWTKAIEAEQAVLDHRETHGCQTAPSASRNHGTSEFPRGKQHAKGRSSIDFIWGFDQN
jgi:hypothetical protein